MTDMKNFTTTLLVLGSFAATAQVGIGTTTPLAGLHVADSSVLFTAEGDIPASGSNVPITGEGRRMMWHPGKAAFRVGYVGSSGSTYWNDANIGPYSFAAGQNTRASGDHAFAVGSATTAAGNASVALGNNGAAIANRAFAFNGTASGIGAIALGSAAQSTGDDAVAIGPSSIAGGISSVTIGPSISNGSFSIAIGLQNRAGGNFSMALGKNARVIHHGSCVISDASAGFTSDSAYSTASNQMTMRYAGGYRLFTDMRLSTGVQLAAGAGAWSTVSDERRKENFRPIDPEAILQKVAQLRITNWNYKAQSPDTRHIGPVAQEFYAAFGLDGVGNDTTINTIDIDGVNMAAIQALEKRTVRLQEENDALKAQLKAVEERMAAFEKRIIEASVVDPQGTPGS